MLQLVLSVDCANEKELWQPPEPFPLVLVPISTHFFAFLSSQFLGKTCTSCIGSNVMMSTNDQLPIERARKSELEKWDIRRRFSRSWYKLSCFVQSCRIPGTGWTGTWMDCRSSPINSNVTKHLLRCHFEPDIRRLELICTVLPQPWHTVHTIVCTILFTLQSAESNWIEVVATRIQKWAHFPNNGTFFKLSLHLCATCLQPVFPFTQRHFSPPSPVALEHRTQLLYPKCVGLKQFVFCSESSTMSCSRAPFQLLFTVIVNYLILMLTRLWSEISMSIRLSPWLTRRTITGGYTYPVVDVLNCCIVLKNLHQLRAFASVISWT